MFDSSKVIEPSGFEPLKFYCITQKNIKSIDRFDFISFCIIIFLIRHFFQSKRTDIFVISPYVFVKRYDI